LGASSGVSAVAAGSYGGAGNRQFDFKTGKRLDTIDWKGQEIVPIVKEFWAEHPNIADRRWEESERIRLRHSIHVTGINHQEAPKPVESLEELPFPDWAIQVIRQQGFDNLTPIQVQGWPAALKGHDIIGISETGSGKTMAYVVPMLIHIQAQPELRPREGPIGLVLVPHRELCKQVAAEIDKFAIHTQIQVAALCGGEDERVQVNQLLGRVDVIVATPGRLIYLLNERHTNLKRATYVVLDEADDLFNDSFSDQVKLLLTHVRPDRQVLLFSATWDEKVEEVAEKICNVQPITIVVGSTKLAACKDISQITVKVGQPQLQGGSTKMHILLDALRKVPPQEKVLVFLQLEDNSP
jgi:ATP-dependent RNA helicase DDX5/DBP2